MNARRFAERLMLSLRKRQRWWEKNENDPHNIGNAMIMALHEVSESVLDSLPPPKKNKRS